MTNRIAILEELIIQEKDNYREANNNAFELDFTLTEMRSEGMEDTERYKYIEQLAITEYENSDEAISNLKNLRAELKELQRKEEI